MRGWKAPEVMVSEATPSFLLLNTWTYVFYLLGTQHREMDLGLRNLPNPAG